MKPRNQTTGNAGLYFVCYRLSTLGWNVMPTARNARGIDLIAYSADAKTVISVQVKSLTARSPVPLGSRVDNLLGDFFVICRKVFGEPECFVMRPMEVSELAHRGTKDEKVSYWLQPRQYESATFREAWTRINSVAGMIEKTSVGEDIPTKPASTAEDLVKKYGSKSAAIRAMATAGKGRSEIARLLGIRYQHVRNVLVTPLTPRKTR